MGIEKGTEWGQPGKFPDDAPVVSSDVDAARLIGSTQTTLAVAGGDLARTLGVRAPYDRSGSKQLLPVDGMRIEIDDGPAVYAVAHVVVGDLRFHTNVTAVMNAAFVGALNIAPRAHPGDGKLDVVSFELGFADRFKARKRMISGTHMPHPGITVGRRADGVIQLERPKPVRVDGKLLGRATVVRYTLLADALTVAV